MNGTGFGVRDSGVVSNRVADARPRPTIASAIRPKLTSQAWRGHRREIARPKMNSSAATASSSIPMTRPSVKLIVIGCLHRR